MTSKRLRVTITGILKRRDDILKREGFIRQERRWLIRGTITSQGMKMIRRERMSFYSNFKGLGYRDAIRDIYRTEGWTFLDGRLNPFKMMNAFYIQTNIVDTPQPKRRLVRKPGTYQEKAAKARESAEQRKMRETHDDFIREHRLR